jgi:superoxide dismutase
MAFQLPDLPYDYEALAPYMSSKTLHLHHDKHHQTYVTNLNNLIGDTEFANKSLEERRCRQAGYLQQCRPALEPQPVLADHEEGGRRQPRR